MIRVLLVIFGVAAAISYAQAGMPSKAIELIIFGKTSSASGGGGGGGCTGTIDLSSGCKLPMLGG
jgi:hypothetical protein